tara:strand:+ start:212 stop:568 length:357 start_codon:yes stop_codon:yes gene_type:complete
MTKILEHASGEQSSSVSNCLVTEDQIRLLIQDKLSTETSIKPVDGFNLKMSKMQHAQKIFFAAKCKCGTSALITVDVANDKTLDDVKMSASQLARQLEKQADSFYEMSCDVHKKIRIG